MADYSKPLLPFLQQPDPFIGTAHGAGPTSPLRGEGKVGGAIFLAKLIPVLFATLILCSLFPMKAAF